MGIGRNYAKKHSKFISFDEDGIIEGVFNGMKPIVKESFGEEKEVMRYKIDDKTFDSQSAGLAIQMDDVKPGQRIKITKTGAGMETKYVVSIINGTPQSTNDWPEEEPQEA